MQNTEERRAVRARYMRSWRQRHPGYSSKYRKYGLTLADFEAMVNAQNGRCAICGTAPLGNLDVDHDHRAGRVRGLLCNRCNKAIGYFRDDAALLRRAQDYLAVGAS